MFNYINFEMFIMLTNSYVFSHVDYCLTIYGCRPKEALDSLQHKISKYVLSYTYKTKTLSKILKTKGKHFHRLNFEIPKDILYNLYEKCNFLTLNERLTYYSVIQMFKILTFGSNCTHFDNICLNFHSVNLLDLTI